MSYSEPGQRDALKRHGFRRPTLHVVTSRLARIQFAAVVILALVAPSLNRGPFAWLPFVTLFDLAEPPLAAGPLSLMPASLGLTWALARLLECPRRPWVWGRAGVALPLLGLTAIMVFSLELTIDHRTLVILLSLALVWSIYLFVVNEKPALSLPLALVVLVQGTVAIGQFISQRNLGVSLLGEPVLDPQLSGIAVVWARGRRWLRAYGLTGHPSVLGATLAVLLLLLADDIGEARGWRQVGYTLVASIGALGLLTTFSRSAWLAFAMGLLLWFLRRTIGKQQAGRSQNERAPLRRSQFLVPVLAAAVFLLLHHDLVASRFFHLETPIEARSIRERQQDLSLAIQLIRQHPWRGVGANNYLVAVRALEPNSRTVHNVPLLTAAELGLPGAALWVWLGLTGLLHPVSAAWPAWTAMLVTNVFDIALYVSNSFFASVVFGLLSAQISLRGPSDHWRPSTKP
ncbi:MAG: O-antigen ligase family protein [Anaerolineae bacterium]|jgi:hypothetical protein